MTCEKCGFEYTGDTCPVCAAEEANKAVAAENKRSRLGPIGMIMAIASFFYVGTPLTIAGLILSVIGKKKNKKDGFATAGLITSIICLVYNVMNSVLAIVIIVVVYTFMFVIGIGSGAMTV